MSDAFTPMPAPTSALSGALQDILDKAPLPDPKTGVTKRPRGRPPGSRNKVKPVEGGVDTQRSRLVIPTERKRETPSSPIDDAKAIKELKKAKADEYAAWINKELNDQLFTIIIGATNMPAELFYKAGRVPPKSASNPDLTDFGNQIAIPADVSASWGKLLAELSYTDMGKNLTKATEGKSLGLVVAAISAVYSTFRYTQQLKPFLDAVKQNQNKPESEPEEQ